MGDELDPRPGRKVPYEARRVDVGSSGLHTVMGRTVIVSRGESPHPRSPTPPQRGVPNLIRGGRGNRRGEGLGETSGTDTGFKSRVSTYGAASHWSTVRGVHVHSPSMKVDPWLTHFWRHYLQHLTINKNSYILHIPSSMFPSLNSVGGVGGWIFVGLL